MTKVVSRGLGFIPSRTRRLTRRPVRALVFFVYGKLIYGNLIYGKLAEAEKFIWERELFSTCFWKSKNMALACFLACHRGCVIPHALRERGRKMGMEEKIG